MRRLSGFPALAQKYWSVPAGNIDRKSRLVKGTTNPAHQVDGDLGKSLSILLTGVAFPFHAQPVEGIDDLEEAQ